MGLYIHDACTAGHGEPESSSDRGHSHGHRVAAYFTHRQREPAGTGWVRRSSCGGVHVWHTAKRRTQLVLCYEGPVWDHNQQAQICYERTAYERVGRMPRVAYPSPADI